MNVAYINKEKYEVENFKYLCQDLEEIDNLECFTDREEFLIYIKNNNVKLVFLDTDWELFEKIKEIDERIAISILTSDKKQSMRAFEVGAFGYNLKPYTSGDIQKVVVRLKNIIDNRKIKDVRIKAFGRFDIFVDGKALYFSNKKAKEFLALLVDHRGGVVTMDETIDILWEDRVPDDRTKALYRMAVKNLRDTLKSAGCDDILVEARGQRSIDFSRIDCDYYKFFNDPKRNRQLFSGEYMTEYSWGEYTLAKIFAKYNLTRS